MKLTELKAKIKIEMLNFYLNKEEIHYFNTPEFFSPLYRGLINSLDHNVEPDLYQNKFKSLSFDVQQELISDKSFAGEGGIYDRYLLLVYPSRFEMSNPRKLKVEELNSSCLLSYLNSEYLRSSKESSSFRIQREIDSVLDLIPGKFRDEFKDSATSSIYKMITLKHKLHLVNQKWMELIKYRTWDESSTASMDNIVDFCLINDKEAKVNTALIKQFYFEIDNGKAIGNETSSARVAQIPYYLHVLEERIRHELFDNLTDGLNLSVVKKKIISRFEVALSEIINNKDYSPIYSDIDQKMLDQLQHTTLVNIHSNELLSEKNLYSKIENKMYQFSDTDWIYSNVENQITMVEKELGLEKGKYKSEWIDIANTLADILTSMNKTISTLQVDIQRGLCMLAIGLVETRPDTYGKIKAKIFGSTNSKYYYPYKDLKNANKFLKDKGLSPKDKIFFSVIKPSTISFFKMLHEELSYSFINQRLGMRLELDSLKEMQSIFFDITYNILSILREQSHIDTIWAIENYYIKSRNEKTPAHIPPLSLRFFDFELDAELGTIEAHFIRTEWKDNNLESMSLRHQLSWNPIEWMKDNCCNNI